MVFDQEIFLLFSIQKSIPQSAGNKTHPAKCAMPNQNKNNSIRYLSEQRNWSYRCLPDCPHHPLFSVTLSPWTKLCLPHWFYCIRMVGFCQSIFSLETRLHRRPGQHHPGNADAIEIFPFILVGSGKSTEESVESMQNNSNLCIT